MSDRSSQIATCHADLYSRSLAPTLSQTRLRCSVSQLLLRPRRHVLLPVVAALSIGLQGCAVHRHQEGNWEMAPNYLGEYAFLEPGKGVHEVLNSCTQNVSATLQCNGRGYCKTFSWNPLVATKPLAFCMCDPEWAGPECSVMRKSQASAFYYSLFLGYLGADYFYLGFPLWGIAKLFTLGGCGFWWLTDIIRIGAGPVYAYNFRTAHDLSHRVALTIMFTLVMVVGFAISVEGYLMQRKKKRLDLAKLQNDEETRHWKHAWADAAKAPRAQQRNVAQRLDRFA